MEVNGRSVPCKVVGSLLAEKFSDVFGRYALDEITTKNTPFRSDKGKIPASKGDGMFFARLIFNIFPAADHV